MNESWFRDAEERTGGEMGEGRVVAGSTDSSGSTWSCVTLEIQFPHIQIKRLSLSVYDRYQMLGYYIKRDR